MRPHRHPAVALVSGAVAFSLVVATQNHAMLRAAGREVAWTDLFAGELPVWLAWVALVPAIAWVSRRFSLPGPPWRILVHLAAASVATFLVVAASLAVRRLMDLPVELTGHGYWETLTSALGAYYAAFLTVYALTIAGERALTFARRAREGDVAAMRLEGMLHRTRLDHLRAQLQPHFLFNALHAISALMRRDVPTARRMMARLSDLLRLSLEGGNDHLHPLAREMEVLETYVDLQEMRFGDRLRVRLDVPDELLRAPVPKLVLQPLVENSIRHGLEARARALEVTVRAEVDGDRLRLTVSDDGPGFASEIREGVGLANTRERLDVLFGEDASIVRRDRDGGGAEVVLEIRRREIP